MAGRLGELARSGARIIAVAGLSLALGWVASAACVGVGVWILSMGQGQGFHGAGTGIVGAILGILVLFRDRPWAMSSVAAGVTGFVVHVVLAQRFVVQSLMRSLWNAGEAKLLEPIVVRGVSALDSVCPEWMTGIVKWTALKANLIAAIGKDSEVGVIRKWIILHILGKLNFTGELPTDREGLSRLLAERIRLFVVEIVEPSMTIYGVVLGCQFLLAVVAIVFEGR